LAENSASADDLKERLIDCAVRVIKVAGRRPTADASRQTHRGATTAFCRNAGDERNASVKTVKNGEDRRRTVCGGNLYDKWRL